MSYNVIYLLQKEKIWLLMENVRNMLALANDFPELYEIEHSIALNGEDEQEVHKSLLQLLRTQVSEWKAFSGRAALNRDLIAA
jgi:hypothetical protein